MTIKKTTRGREYWEDLIQEFNNCKGISLKEFCALNEVGFSTFCRWKSKLSQERSELKAAGSWAPLHIEEDFVEDLNPTPQTARENPSEEDHHNDLCDVQCKPLRKYIWYGGQLSWSDFPSETVSAGFQL